MPTLKADGNTGVVAIYDGADDVLADPLVDITRVHFHSALNYIGVKDIIRVNFTLPASSSSLQQSYAVGAHGQPGQPLVFPILRGWGGRDLPLMGSVFLSIRPYGFHRTLAGGADATDLYLHQELMVGAGTSSWAAQPVTVDFFVTDRLLNEDEDFSGTKAIEISPTRFIASNGKFDSENRYLRAGGQENPFQIVGGRTIQCYNGNQSNSCMRQSIGSYLIRASGRVTSTGSANWPAGSLTTTAVDVGL